MAETTRINGWGGDVTQPVNWLFAKECINGAGKDETHQSCLCGFGGGRNGVAKVAAILQQQCFWSFIFLCCVLDGTCFSSCRLSWDSPAYLKHPLFLPLFLSTLVLLLCNCVKCEEREHSKFRVYGFSELCKFWKLQWPLAFRLSTCRGGGKKYSLYLHAQLKCSLWSIATRH